MLYVFQALLFLLAAVPCGIPYRYNPNPVFPAELMAFGFSVLLVAAASCIPARQRIDGAQARTAVPWAAWFWLALAAVIGLQCVLMPVPYWSERTVPALYMIAAGLSIWGLARAREAFGIEPLVTAFAWGLLAGALFNSAIGAGQMVSLLKFGDGRLIFGNIGQKNMYGHYLTWGMAAACWLLAERKRTNVNIVVTGALVTGITGLLCVLLGRFVWPGQLFDAGITLSGVAAAVVFGGFLANLLPRTALIIALTWLALGVAWSGSRSPLMYAGAWLALAFVLLAFSRDRTRHFAAWLAGAAVLILAMQYIAPLINDVFQHFMHVQTEVPTGLTRLESNGSRRLVEWHKAWLAFQAHPLLGVGWSAYGAQSVLYQVRPEFAVVSESVLFTHAHNSLLNLMAETGVLGTGVALLALGWAALGLWRRRADSTAMLATALVLVSLLHSLVEYPLWYAHFALPFALMLYLVRDDVPQWRWPGEAVQVAQGAAAIVLLVITVLGGSYYVTIYPILESTKDAKQNGLNIATLQRLRSNPFVDYYADFALSNYIMPSHADIPWKLGILDNLNSVRPYPGQLADAAVMHAFKGEADLAHKLMRQAAFAYPESLDYFYEVIGNNKDNAIVASLKPDVDEAYQLFCKAHIICK
ncbi:Protein glycosylation ligase [Andreprevotia lacus DSM 23236]|jgi:O-antigen ligase|uniref:Protein glycosylation ligase n=1 Tax=Andreprevotia lacus DSM 23236 TaxID=1121001 RepID=A0A1W1XSS9_9NEIS|nr:O-antigen ligase family protein [Andreprevotia lacus]SMC27030.1 Protein glycosylation ligase [Andreprevotia lacus DSM 23236]